MNGYRNDVALSVHIMCYEKKKKKWLKKIDDWEKPESCGNRGSIYVELANYYYSANTSNVCGKARRGREKKPCQANVRTFVRVQ